MAGNLELTVYHDKAVFIEGPDGTIIQVFNIGENANLVFHAPPEWLIFRSNLKPGVLEALREKHRKKLYAASANGE